MGLSLVVFLFLIKDLFFGGLSVFHDTFWNGEIIFSLIKQWVKLGLAPGWNPYMNAGEPLYLFSNGFLRAPFFFFCLSSQFVGITTHVLFNLSWVFMYLNFCISSFLFFFLIFDDFKVSFFCFLALLLGGSFYVSMGQPVGLTVLYFLPYILFGLFSSLRYKSPYGVCFTIIYSGLSLNYYLPHYLFLILFVFLTSLFLVQKEYLKTLKDIIRKNYMLIFISVFIAILVAGPAIFLGFEQRKFVSPSRGTSTAGVGLSPDEEGAQPSVSAPLKGYAILLNRYKDIHHAFYFGIIALILIPIAFAGKVEKLIWPFAMTSILAILFGLGKKFFLMCLIVRYIPGFNFIRHTFLFAQFLSFFLILIAGFGLRKLLSKEYEHQFNLFVLAAFLIALLLSVFVDNATILFYVLSSFIAILCSFFMAKFFSRAANFKNIIYIIIISVLILDLYSFNIHTIRHFSIPYSCVPPGKGIGEPGEVKYPISRLFYASKSSSLPVNLWPVFSKEASVTSFSEDSVFFRCIRLNDMLKHYKLLADYESAFGVDMPITYFTCNATMLESSLGREQFINRIFEYASHRENLLNPRVFFRSDEVDFIVPDKNKELFFTIPIKINEKKETPNRIAFLINAPAEGFMVRMENFHSGWRAFVDDLSVRIYRANYAFQAIRIPKGIHRVVFEFKTVYPFLFWISISFSAVVWFLLNLYLSYLGSNRDKAKKVAGTF